MRDALRRAIALAATIGAFALAAAGPEAAQDPPAGEPFAVEATALLPLDVESALSIVGIRGEISVASRDGRELRIISREPGAQGTERPVGIWQSGSKLIVAPPPGDKGGARLMLVEVPRGFAIAVDAADSSVFIQADGGGVDLHGTNVKATVVATGGSFIADLEGGSLVVNESSDATVRCRGTGVEISRMSGNVNVRSAGGKVSLVKVSGSVDVESDESSLVLTDLAGSVRVKAHLGQATVAELKSGAELAMSGTPLRLKDGKGDITVTSDASVDFQNMAASLHLDMYGGSLRGKGNQGILEVRTRNTEVTVETIEQGMRIQGDGLKAKLEDIGGELYIETTLSEVVVDRVGSVIVKVDRGNVTVQRAAGAVLAVVVGGDVHIVDGSGPVTLELDRGDAEVSWASLPGDKDSKLTNKSGNVTVRFPGAGSGRVEARSKYGRIESDLPTVKVADDGTEAQGPVNGGYRPIVQIVASGDISLKDGSKAEGGN